MPYEAFSDEELIEKLRQGEDDITDYILEKYKPLVRKKTNAMYLIGGETEDLIQECEFLSFCGAMYQQTAVFSAGSVEPQEAPAVEFVYFTF